MTEEVKKRPRAKKIKGERIGPFQTNCETFDRGNRQIEVSVTPKGVLYRLKGMKEEYFLPHGTGYIRAVGIAADIDVGPRNGKIKRSGITIG